MTAAFDRDTRTEARPGVEGGYRAHVSDGWNIGPNPNGGYVLALIVNALAREAGPDHPDPLTITAHYLRPTSSNEEADIDVALVRRGRRHTHLEATLTQSTERVRVLAAFGDLGSASGLSMVRSSPPRLPPVDECPARSLTAGGPPGSRPTMPGSTFMDRFDTRLSPATGWLRGERTGVPEVLGWTRFADGRDPDVLSLALFADAFPPAVFELGPTGWVPTIELTVHERARPTPGWLRARFETRFLVEGYLEEDVELWDSDDNLVAQSRQLAMLLS